MKKIINIIIELLKRVFIGRPSAWIDVEVAAEKEEALVVEKDINTLSIDGAVINYNTKANNITIGDVELTITTRIFTKVNNVLKKDGVEAISKEVWSEFEDVIISSQDKGKNTYNALRKKVK